MSTDNTVVSGYYHINIRLKGELAKKRLFLSILQMCDADFPFKSLAGAQLCENCMGLVWQHPRLNPADIKAAARQAGINCKIRRFIPEKVCKPAGVSFGTPPIRWISRELCHTLYEAHGTAVVTELINEENRKLNRDPIRPPLASPTVPKITPILVTAGAERVEVSDLGVIHTTITTDSQLIEEVLSGEEAVECAMRTGSLIQFPDDEKGLVM